MQIPIHLIIAIVGIFQVTFIAAFLIINHKTRNASNLILAAVTILLAVQIVAVFTISKGAWQYFTQYHQHILILFQSSLLIAPSIYLYIRSLLLKDSCLRPADAFHLVPFVGVVIMCIIYLTRTNNYTIINSSLRFYTAIISLVQSLMYLTLIAFLWIRMKRSERKYSTTIDQRQMMKIAVTGFFILWIINLNFFIVLDVMHRTELCPYTTSMYFYSIFILFNIFLFLLLVKPSLLNKKYIESRLAEDHKNKLFEQLLQYMQTQRPYYKPDISLSELSNNLTIPGRILSQIINEKAGQNFFDFINRYRVEECKRLLKEKTRNEKNISEIFYSVGFNSKSSFNTSFKKFTGYTPSEYRAFFS